MQKIIFIFAAVLGLGAAVISVVTTKPMYETQIADLNRVESDLARTKNDLKEMGQAADTAEGKRKEAESLKKATENRITGLNASIASLNREKIALDSKLADLEKDKQGLDTTLNELRIALEEALGTTISEINPDDISNRISQLNEETKNREADLEETQKQLESLQDQVASRSERLTSMQEQQERRRNQLSLNSWSGQVTAVDPEWGFLVFSGGTGRGLSPTAEYIVVRNDQPVASLDIVSMEQGRTIANLTKDSIEAGAQVVPGDRVILADPVTGR